MHGIQEQTHAVLGIGILTVGVREHLDRADIRIRVDHASGHDRACIGLLVRDAPEARDEVVHGRHIAGEPPKHGRG